MKPITYILLLQAILLFSGMKEVQAADHYLTYGATADLSREQLHYYEVVRVEETNLVPDIVYLDPARLLEEDRLVLNFPDGTTKTMVIDRRELNRTDMTSVFGHIEEVNGDVHIVVHRNDVTGLIRVDRTYWGLTPLTGGPHTFYEIDQSRFPHDESDEGYEMMNRNVDLRFEVDDVDDFGTDDAGKSSGAMAGNCKIRVGVVYTDDVRAAHSNVLAKIQNAINLTNSSFDNSTVNTDIELAFAIERSYAETGNLFTDLPRFQGTTDGFMDDIHTIRNRYDADIMHLLVKDGGSFCGLASGIGSSSSSAFCMTDIDCAEGNLTFGHEQGHLYGNRHDLFVDPLILPIVYAHGFVNTSVQMRTVMAYNDACSFAGTSCTRVANYSDPTVDFPGTSSPTGTTGFEHNERVMDDVDDNIIVYRTEPSALNFISTSESIGNREFADAFALNSINAISPQYHIENGGTAVFRAGSSIFLGPGFHAKGGSAFDAFLDGCTNNTSPPSKEEPDNMVAEEQAIGTTVVSELTIHPNPFGEQTTVQLSLTESALVTIYVLDVSGRILEELIHSRELPEGQHEWRLDASSWSAGTYLCVTEVDGTVKREKMIVTK